MSVDAIDDHLTLNELNAIVEASSTWNGRDVQCAPLDDEALLVRTLAIAHLEAQKEGPQAVRKLEQEIYALGSLENEEGGDSELELNDHEMDSLIHLTQNLTCWTSPELLRAEERVKLLLNDPTRPCEPLQLNKSFFGKAAKMARHAGRNTKKVIKKHKKALIVTAVAVAAVAVVVITAGAAAPEAVAAVAASTAAPSSSSGKKRDEKDQPPPPQSSAPPPPPPIDLKPIQPSELHAWTAPSMVITKTPLLATENRMAISQVSQSVQTPQLIPGSDVHAATSKTNITVSYQPKGQSPLTSINYYPMNEIPPLVVISNEKSPEDKAHSSDLEKNSVSDTNHRFTMDSQIHPIRRTSETEQISATAIAAMNPSVQPTTETHPLKTGGENPVNVSASGFSHLFWKTVGIVVDNTFALGEMFNPTISIPPKKSAQEAWNQDVVPLVHEKIDQTFGTEIKEEFNRNNDSWAKRAMDTIIYSPFSYLTNLGTTAYKAINGVSKEGVFPSTVLQEATATGTVGKLAGETTAGRLEGQIISKETGIAEARVGSTTQTQIVKNEQIATVEVEGRECLTNGKVKFFENNLKHIFREDAGHLIDSPANRQLLIDTASNPHNYIGKDKFGNEWYVKTINDGSQLWTQVVDGQIRNGGLNQVPRNFESIIVSK